ncbi:glycosyltransferase [Gottfriedia acidiceleris]|uniref:Glycosyltransferase n=1 Tax=Gottfriedia acidiceleris TaxID=371036 RepID=A0ABY4JJZ2_9BACI|nr:glycosyltransferase [Gottfriedia acidiceleris]UPM54165.1 glycosyltransferase [Gottfriedia acidiceleris]
MKKNILVASFDLEIGGVERSLISMLNNFDYNNYVVDLMLYSHSGEFMKLLPKKANLLAESKAYKTFRMPVLDVVKSGQISLALSRMLAKYLANKNHSSENGYKQMQYMWKYSVPLLPKQNKKYDVAISYLWPHYFVAEKVDAEIKIAWVHTDFSTVETDIALDVKMWGKFNYIVAVSDECKNAFISKYPVLVDRVIVMENITTPELINTLANEEDDNPMVEDARFKIITVARLSYAKGIDSAVKALKMLNDRGYKNICWYVVGYGGDEQQIKDLIGENKLTDQFILLGKKTNPYPFIKEADLYVQPSRYEGKAVTVVEAQVLSKPVLITNYPTAKSQVNDGFDGSICDLSVKGIADGIEKLYLDSQLREHLANNCKGTVFSNLSELNKLYSLI